MSSLLIARQPIFNPTLDVVGYQLLHRSYPNVYALADGGNQAIPQTTLEQSNEIGLANLVGDKRAFINANRSYLTGKSPIPLPPASVVLEVTALFHQKVPLGGYLNSSSSTSAANGIIS